MSLSISKIKMIQDSIKSIKDDFMYLSNDGTAYSTDEYFTYLKVLKTDIVGYELSFKTTELNAFVKNMAKYNSDCTLVVDMFNNLFLHPTEVIKVKFDEDPVLPLIINTHIPKFIVLINSIIGYNRISSCVYESSNIKENGDFSEIIAKKASEGISIFNIDDRYILTLCARLFPINKKDVVEFRLKPIDFNRYFLSVRIVKSKSVIVDMYLAILNP